MNNQIEKVKHKMQEKPTIYKNANPMKFQIN